MPTPHGDALSWAAAAVAADAAVVSHVGLTEQGDAGPWLLEIAVAGSTTQAVLKLGDPRQAAVRARFATEAAALEIAGRHGLPAPRLLCADLDGGASGQLAVLTTLLEGSSRIPREPEPGRLRVLGRTAAEIHAVGGTPTTALPLRDRPLEGVDFSDVDVPGRSADLLATARQILHERRVDAESPGFVHGDLWHGNTLWDGRRLAGAIDWDYAGFGPAGVDLGTLRCDAALLYGGAAADEVLAGWEAAHGERPPGVARWDVVAALSTPPDVADWLPVIHQQGRADLDPETLTARRDAFLAAAIRCLG